MIITRTPNPALVEVGLHSNHQDAALSMNVPSWGVVGLRAAAETDEPTDRTDKAPEYPITRKIPLKALGSALGALLGAGIYLEDTLPEGPDKDYEVARTHVAMTILEFFTDYAHSQSAAILPSPSL